MLEQRIHVQTLGDWACWTIWRWRGGYRAERILRIHETRSPPTEFSCQDCPEDVIVSTATGPNEAYDHGRLHHSGAVDGGFHISCSDKCHYIFYEKEGAIRHWLGYKAQSSASANPKQIGPFSMLTGRTHIANRLNYSWTWCVRQMPLHTPRRHYRRVLHRGPRLL